MELYCVFQDRITNWSEQNINTIPVYRCEDCLPRICHIEEKDLVDIDGGKSMEMCVKLAKAYADLISPVLSKVRKREVIK